MPRLRVEQPGHLQARRGGARLYQAQVRAADTGRASNLQEINRLTVYVTLRYVGDGTWTAPLLRPSLDPGLLRLVNHYLHALSAPA